MDYAEQILAGLDYVIKARLQEYKFDETIICTVVDDTKASEGLYVVSDGTIKFDAYSESVDYKVDQSVRVNVPKGDYSQKKYIVGKAVSEKNGNQPIVYSAPSAQILDLTGNIFPETSSGRNWSIFANESEHKATEKLIKSINLRDEYEGLIYDTLYLKANFKTIFNQYSMCDGGYGIYIKATMSSKDNNGRQNQRIYYLDSKNMFGNPYNYLISSSQEIKFFIGKDEGITNVEIYLYQDGRFKYRDDAGNIHNYPKSKLAEDIIVSNIYIGLGVDLTEVEDNKVEIQTAESHYYNDPKTDVDNTKIIRLQWYNKDENNQYIGFSDGEVLIPQNRKFLFIGDSYGVGQNSESWHGWPYYTAVSLGFDKPEYGGMYYSKTEKNDKGEDVSLGVARYVNTDPQWNQWIAIAQQNVGFVGQSTYVPVDNTWENNDPGRAYNFASVAEKAADFLRTASYNSVGNNKLPPLPDEAKGQYTSEIKEQITDIVIAGGWSDRGKQKKEIAAGIIDFIRAAVNVTRIINSKEEEDTGESSVQRIYIIGSDSCSNDYASANSAKEELKTVYSHYKEIINALNMGSEIEYYKKDDNNTVISATKSFTERDNNGQLKIIYANNAKKNCPELIFYDIHEVLSDDDFKNDTETKIVRGEDDNIHPAASGYWQLGREISRRVRLIESELDYAKRLSEHNRIVAQMEKDGVPDDYAGFELNARYEEIKDLKTTLINLINIDLYQEVKSFQYALNGKAENRFVEWLNALDGEEGKSDGYGKKTIDAFNNLVKFYEDGLSFANNAQKDLLIYKDGKFSLKDNKDNLAKPLEKPSGLRKLENQLLGKITNEDWRSYNSGENVEEVGLLKRIENSINDRLRVIKETIKSEVNLGSIYDGYKIRIEKIRDKIIEKRARLKALSCGNLYPIDADLDNNWGNDTTVDYYTSWYLFEDPLHPDPITSTDSSKRGQGLLTNRILIDEESKVSLYKKTYDPSKFDKKPNQYSIYWYYYRDGYKAREGENHLGGDNWCEIIDSGIVNGKSRFTVVNTNDNIGLPTPIYNEVSKQNEYPVKPEIDDENGYLTISFSKERPDIKEEKIKAIIIYNHEKYESNVLTFENKDPAAGPELTNGIQIVHGSNSQAVYPLYGVDNTLIKASEENIKRQLKVQYLNERGEPESGNETVLKGASIYWYVPTYATMLRTDDSDLVSPSGSQENFVKGSMVEWDFTVEKTMDDNNGKDPYVDSCTLKYTTERPIFKGNYDNNSNVDLYLFRGQTLKVNWGRLTDGGVVTKNDDNTKVIITYTYTYNRNDGYKKFYINTYNNKQHSEKGTNDPENWNIVTPLTYGGITYSISEDGKYIIASDNTKYRIDSDNKIILPIDTLDENDQKGYEYYYKRIENAEDLTFTYRIKDYYSDSFTNNTIKCKVVKGNQQLESSIDMDFNSYGSNGTNYSLVIKPLPLAEGDIEFKDYTDSNGNKISLIVNYRAFEIMLFDYESKQIPFGSAPIVKITGGGTPTVTLEPSASNEAGVLSYITNKIEVPHYNYHPWILEVTAEQPWPLNSNNSVELKSFYPIPLSGIGIEENPGPYQGDFPTTIVYDSLGGTPSYYKNPLTLYDKNGKLVENCVWSILYFKYDENTDERVEPPTRKDNESDDEYQKRYKNYLKTINFLPKLEGSVNGVAKLIPSAMYVNDGDKIRAVLKCGTNDNNNALRWLQPLWICQNRYPSAMLNNWDGGLSIDEEDNTILANIVGAGKKEGDNSFSGVLMGEVEHEIPTETIRDDLQHSHTGLGLYGFHHGEQSFGFNVNGTAFIGKSGKGRIAFDGTNGFIYSGNWLNSFTSDYEENDYNYNRPFLKDTNNNITLNTSKQGMAIDLQNGHIDAYNFKLSSAGIQLNSDPDSKAGEDYIYIGEKDENGTDPDQFIKYTANGDLIMRISSLSLTGTIGDQNLLNNTAPKEALNLEPGTWPGDYIQLNGWHTISEADDEGVNGKNQRCRTKVARSTNGKSWIVIDNHLSNNQTEDDAQTLRTLYQYINPAQNTNTVSNFSQGKYTLSGTIYSDASRKVVFRLGSWDSGKGMVSSPEIFVNGAYKSFHYTFNITSDNVPQVFWINDEYNGTSSGNKTLATWFNHLKLEKGTVATPWNESDIDSYYTSAANQLNQDIVFNKLTDNGKTKGMFLSNNQLYINANYIAANIIRSSNWTATYTVKGEAYDQSQLEELIEKNPSLSIDNINATEGMYINLNDGKIWSKHFELNAWEHTDDKGGIIMRDTYTFETDTSLVSNSMFIIGDGQDGNKSYIRYRFKKERINDTPKGYLTINTENFKLQENGNVSVAGHINANSGTISGWSISNTGISKSVTEDGEPGTQPYWYVCVDAPETYDTANAEESSAFLMVKHVNSDNKSDFPFYVRHNGFLKATNADITGTISATGGNIAGWNIKSVDRQNKGIYRDYNGYYTGMFSAWNSGVTEIAGLKSADWRFVAGENTQKDEKFTKLKFGVTKQGQLAANSGIIGGWTISESGLTSGNSTLGSNGNFTFERMSDKSNGVKLVLEFDGLVLHQWIKGAHQTIKLTGSGLVQIEEE